MTNKKLTRAVLGFVMLIIVSWIFLNPWTDAQMLGKKPEILININNFFGYAGFGYRLVLRDLCDAVRFTEYLVFGIIAMLNTKAWSKNIFKSITEPLFIGIVVSVSEIYYRFLCDFNIGVTEIIISFVGFCTGIIFYIIFTGIKPAKKTGFKYKSLKYDGRR